MAEVYSFFLPHRGQGVGPQLAEVLGAHYWFVLRSAPYWCSWNHMQCWGSARAWSYVGQAPYLLYYIISPVYGGRSLTSKKVRVLIIFNKVHIIKSNTIIVTKTKCKLVQYSNSTSTLSKCARNINTRGYKHLHTIVVLFINSKTIYSQAIVKALTPSVNVF